MLKQNLMARLKRKKSVAKKRKKRKKALDDNQRVLLAKDRSDSITSSQGVNNRFLEKGPSKVIRIAQGFSQPEFWVKTKQFIREVKIELKKVTWPTRQDTLASTLVVLVMVIIISAFLGIVDVGLSSLVRLILE